MSNETNPPDDLSVSLEKTLATSELVDLSQELVELSIDSLLADGLIRALPVINTLVGFWKTGIAVRDALFLKKLVTFLRTLKDIPTEKRREMVESLADPATGERVGEKLVGLLDRFDSAAKARMLAAAFAAYVDGTVTRDEFWRISFIIDRLPMSDILAIQTWKSIDMNLVDEIRRQLYLSVGLGSFVLNSSSTGFVWNQRLCVLLSGLVIGSTKHE